jgi:DNA-directed RNA polymerase subunit beta'
MADASTFDKIRISIASPDQIRNWSYGEVKKPETINYRTFKPERDGLFCEKIFGPQKDWECHCGRYKKVKFKGIICDRCGVEVTRSKVRRERMGHIELASPVCHIWYLKGVPSPLALLLDMTPRPLEKVLYFASYIVTSVDKGRTLAGMDQFRDAVNVETAAIQDDRDEAIREYRDDFARDIAQGRPIIAESTGEEGEAEEQETEYEPYTEEEISDREKQLNERIKQEEKDAEERAAELQSALELLRTLEKRQLINEDQWRAIERLLTVLAERVDETLYDGLNTPDSTSIVRAGLGGAAIKELLMEIDLDSLQRQLRKEIEETQGPKRLRAIKRIEVVNAFIESKSRPEWMILDAVPVISPELRPMVQLDGGRFATSDLNDLYRRIINRNNRLKKITEIRAPESIVNHEKRLLQEAVDALIDNGRRTRPVTGSNGRPLKSLSDMLKGKEGRFRKNLLGKRVDYSGRSVIVVGPELHLHECGLPKEMALELFKPFVMKTLVERQYTSNIKTAKRMIDKMRPEVWDALEEVIKEHPVLLNRAPTLHRLGIQAFEPKLVDGKAIQLHPLVCKAFNADFDGDQMAVHIPLSATAQAEARVLMLSTHNLFSPADGSPIVSPQQDIVLGNYFLTMEKKTLQLVDHPARGLKSDFGGAQGAELTALLVGRKVTEDVKDPETGAVLVKKGERIQPETAETIAAKAATFKEIGIVRHRPFASAEDALLAYEQGLLDLHDYIEVRLPVYGSADMELLTITPGRLIFNQIVPAPLRYVNKTMDKNGLGTLISDVHKAVGDEGTITLLDDMKALGFRWACKAGITFSLTDMKSPESRAAILRDTEERVTKANQDFRRGVTTAGERKSKVLELWTKATATIADEIIANIEQFNPINIITDSKARGSKKQLAQLSGMRGLMADPFGNIIEDLPVKSNFHEGLSVLEYFVTTHGARKGLADTALRTADAGYLTRRLVDVAQDVIIREIDCGTEQGIEVKAIREGDDVIETLAERLKGRTALDDIVHPETGEILVGKAEIIANDVAEAIDAAGIKKVALRSVLTCESRQGVCATCYGRDLANNKKVEIGVAVGIIAAQSIGEPGTQLTMRTFHTGGIASANQLTGVANVKRSRAANLEMLYEDSEKGRISLGSEEGHEREKMRQVQQLLKVAEEQVGGLLRVVELFEARKPKGQAIVSEYGGLVAAITTEGLRKVVVHTDRKVSEDAKSIKDEIAAEDIKNPENGEVIVPKGKQITEREARKVRDAGIEKILVRKETVVPYRGELQVKEPRPSEGFEGDIIEPGDRLTAGPLDPHKVLELQGARGVQEYLTAEVQNVYKQQGVDINDKHIEVIIRQMLRKRKIIDPGNCDFLPGQMVDRFQVEDANREIRARGEGKVATHGPVLLGITEASLATESFLSAASFQKTTRVLTEAAVRGKRDALVGLKENVIIGRLIPAGTGLAQYRALEVTGQDGKMLTSERDRRLPDLDAEGLEDDLAMLDSRRAAAAAQLGAESPETDSLGGGGGSILDAFGGSDGE